MTKVTSSQAAGSLEDSQRPRGHPRFSRIEDFADFIKSPDSTHYVRPLWFWNTSIDEALIASQLDAMRDQGLRRFYIHSRSGMRPKYLTEEWWQLIGVTVEHARRRGMQVGLVDEFNWPSGELRDFRLAGTPSRVLAMMPGAQMRMLVEVDDAAAGEPLLVVHGVIDDDGSLDPAMLHLAEECRDPTNCREFSYVLVTTDGVDGGTVDLLSPHAVDLFIDGFYGELVRRFRSDIGSTIFGTFCDHEGDFGRRLVYTPALFDEFLERKGYDLRRFLPLLSRDHDEAAVIRRDWFDVISDLYASNFFGRIAAFAHANGLEVTGHTWEESLLLEAAFEGHALRIQRQWSNPGVDSLAEWGRRPRHLREGLSIARIHGRDLVVESQGVQGAGSYQSPERIRQLTDMLILWGANVLCPHAFNADQHRSDFPEDWFLSQPWWPYFGSYVDYATRLAAFNHVGSPEPAVAIVYPIESVWAHSQPYFDGSWDYSLNPFSWSDGPRPQWQNDADAVETCYDELIGALSQRRLDFDIVDLDALHDARVMGGDVLIGDMRYPGLIVPAMTFVDHRLHGELTRLAAAGASIRIIRPPDMPIVETADLAGRHDWAGHFIDSNSRPNVGVYDDVPAAVASIEQSCDQPWRLTQVSVPDVFASGKRADDGWLLWIVADGTAGSATLALPGEVVSVVEFDPQTGRACRLVTSQDGTVSLSLPSRRGRLLWLVTDPAIGRDLAVGVDRDRNMSPANIGTRTLTDGWTVEVLNNEKCALPWVIAGGASDTPTTTADSAMSPFWLGAGRAGIREWMVIGPFPNTDETGWHTPFPPELAFDPDAVYPGRHQRPVQWIPYRSPGPVISLDDALRLAAPESGNPPECTVYARTSVFCREPRHVMMAAIGDSAIKAWLNGTAILNNRDDHSGYIEMTAPFAQTAAVSLRQGWNTLLIKVTRGNRPLRQCRFSVWFVESDGMIAADLGCHPLAGDAGTDMTPLVTTPPHIRVVLPAGTSQLVAPGVGPSSRAWLGGRTVRFQNGIAQFGVDSQPATLDIAVGGSDQIRGPLVATVQPAPCRLGNLTHTPLRFISGVFRYRCTASLPAMASGVRVELTLGDVGVAASVQVNGILLAPRAWPPFTWDVTGVVSPGENHIAVDIANTGAGRRAAQYADDSPDGLITHGPNLLEHLDLNGLHGPVRLSWGQVTDSRAIGA